MVRKEDLMDWLEERKKERVDKGLWTTLDEDYMTSIVGRLKYYDVFVEQIDKLGHYARALEIWESHPAEH